MKCLEDVDWDNWTPKETATLLFVVRGGRILLIRKKRGLGAGKINGPGGRLEKGETAKECAIRETEEELCITPRWLKQRGILKFQFCDGYSLHGTVFTATGYTGTPTETDEADPLWFGVGEIPYDEMWEDDQYWLPQVLDGQNFEGRFLFDGDKMLGKHLNFSTP